MRWLVIEKIWENATNLFTRSDLQFGPRIFSGKSKIVLLSQFSWNFFLIQNLPEHHGVPQCGEGHNNQVIILSLVSVSKKLIIVVKSITK